MQINLWYSEKLSQWRWTLTEQHSERMLQKSGQNPVLKHAMNDVANTVEHMLECNKQQ
jgi:hypothetical protein|tara:strand:- start:3572 stop:3745 length:174 start_codon:yes stop_codon:yes gene_type:complete